MRKYNLIFGLMLVSMISFGQTKAKKSKVEPKKIADKVQAKGKKITTKGGSVITFYKDDVSTPNIIIGDFIKIRVKNLIKDSLQFDSDKANNGQPIPLTVSAPQINGDPMEAFPYLSQGDSVEIMVKADSLYRGNYPPNSGLKSGDLIRFKIKIESVKSKAEMEKEKAENSSKQIKIDEEKLQAYFKKNNLSPIKLKSGVYYVMTQAGTGEMPNPGQLVSVNYTGKNLNGVVFDSNVDSNFHHVEPLEFPVGEGRVIQGWDKSFLELKKGEKGTLFIPSHLAYGENAPPGSPIKPNDILIFDVNLLDIKNVSAEDTQGQ